MNTTLITLEEAEAAKKRARYARLKITNPEEANLIHKEHIKKQLLAAAERGPIQIFPLASRFYM